MRTIAFGTAVLALLTVGAPPARATTCPAGGDLTTPAQILPELLVDEATLAQWQQAMVGLGPRFTGSPAHKSWHDFWPRSWPRAGSASCASRSLSSGGTTRGGR